jgi:hypothetical protein
MNDMTLSKLSHAVREIGFPAVVASALLWAFLVRQPRDMEELRAAIDRNTQALISLQRSQEALREAVRR